MVVTRLSSGHMTNGSARSAWGGGVHRLIIWNTYRGPRTDIRDTRTTAHLLDLRTSLCSLRSYLSRRQCQVESLAGAAHLSNDR